MMRVSRVLALVAAVAALLAVGSADALRIGLVTQGQFDSSEQLDFNSYASRDGVIPELIGALQVAGFDFVLLSSAPDENYETVTTTYEHSTAGTVSVFHYYHPLGVSELFSELDALIFMAEDNSGFSSSPSQVNVFMESVVSFVEDGGLLWVYGRYDTSEINSLMYACGVSSDLSSSTAVYDGDLPWNTLNATEAAGTPLVGPWGDLSGKRGFSPDANVLDDGTTNYVQNPSDVLAFGAYRYGVASLSLNNASFTPVGASPSKGLLAHVGGYLATHIRYDNGGECNVVDQASDLGVYHKASFAKTLIMNSFAARCPAGCAACTADNLCTMAVNAEVAGNVSAANAASGDADPFSFGDQTFSDGAATAFLVLFCVCVIALGAICTVGYCNHKKFKEGTDSGSLSS